MFCRASHLLLLIFVPYVSATEQLTCDRKKLFVANESYELISNTNGHCDQDNFHFDGSSLIVNVTENEFILVRPNDWDIPFFELCGRFQGCDDRTFICYESQPERILPGRFCSPDNLQTIEISSSIINVAASIIHLNPDDTGCRKIFLKNTTTSEGEILYYLATLEESTPQNSISKVLFYPFADDMIQMKLKVVQSSYCGLILRFPEAFIAIDAPPTTTPIPTTTPTTIKTTRAILPTSAAIIQTTTEETDDSSVISTVAIVLGVVAFLLIVIVVGGLIIRCIIKRRRNNSVTFPTIPKETRSMESLSYLAAPKPIPMFLDPALEDKTQELSSSQPAKASQAQPLKSIVDTAQKPTTQDPLKSVLSKQGTKELLANGKEGGAAAAVAAMKEDKDSSDSEIPLPALTVDMTKKYTKIYKYEFERGQEDSIASEENCGENIYKIEVFCSQPIPLPDLTMSKYPPDYVANMAVRAPNIEHRGIFHYQAVILANNLLLKKGIKNNKGTISGSPKALKWLRTRQNIPFVQFISECVENAPDSTGPEFLSSKIQWRRHLKKIDLIETYRQACWIGQTNQRREFFLLATFYKMEQLVKQYPSEDDLKTFPFPVPMFLALRKEAPNFFEIIDNAPPSAGKKSAATTPAAPETTNNPSQIPKFSN